MLDPLVADLRGDQFREPRVGQRDPAPRVTPFVTFTKRSGIQLIQVFQDGLSKKIAVQGRHAIDPWLPTEARCAMRTYFSPALIDDRQSGGPLIITRISETDFVKKSAVDLVDDLDVSGERAAEKRQGPFLERLGQQRMVRVRHRLLRYLHALSSI